MQLARRFRRSPPEIARDADVLVITRTWHFVSDTLETGPMTEAPPLPAMP